MTSTRDCRSLARMFAFILMSFGFVVSAATTGSTLDDYALSAKDSKKRMEYWKREAQYLGLREMEWTLDPHGSCSHFITILPATIETQAPPLLLIHRPSNEEYFRITGAKADALSLGALAGFIDWMALKQTMDSKRNRDVIFIQSCGEEAWSRFGTRDLVHYLIRSLPGVDYTWTSFQKVEAASVWAKFPELRRVELVLSHSVPAFHFDGHVEIFLPLVTASKGFWQGKIAGQSFVTVKTMTKKKDSIWNTWRSLHPEMDDFAKVASQTLPWWQQVVVWMRSRFFFRYQGWESFIENEWKFDSSEEIVSFHFLGDREQREIEKDIGTDFIGRDYIPFRRSFMMSPDSQLVYKTLRETSGVRPFRFISPEVSEASFFRWANIEAYDLFPIAVSRSRQIPFDLDLKEIDRAIDIKSGILQKLFQ